jgi:hypothetical protein
MQITFSSINFLAVALSAVVGVFGIGGLWYSPMVFGSIWGREAGFGEMTQKKQGHPAIVYGLSLVMGLISAALFAALLGPNPALEHSLCLGLVVGAGFAATSFAINYAFSGRSIKLFAIDGGYHTVQFVCYGLILGLWH